MQDILPTTTQTVGGEAVMTVNARDLHQFLDVLTPFHKWITRRIEEYGFTQAIDFLAMDKNVRSEGWFGPREVTEYFLTLDMAKELAMVERSEKGRLARRYFIEMERRVFHTSQTIEQMREALLKSRPDWAKLVRYNELGLSVAEKATLMGCSKDALRMREIGLEKLGLITRKVNPLLRLAGQHGKQVAQRRAEVRKQQLPLLGGEA